MHRNQNLAMKYFVKNYASTLSKDHISVADVGSKDVNGYDRGTFPEPRDTYVGCAIVPVTNVDIVFDDENNWQDIGQFDVVITSSTIEHVRDIYKFVRNLATLVKPGGLLYIHGPALAGCHDYPVDCWRILPDGMRFLLEDVAKLDVLEVKMWKSPYDEKHIDILSVARKAE